MREIRTLRVMCRELETRLGGTLRPTAPVPDPTEGQKNDQTAGLRKPCYGRAAFITALWPRTAVASDSCSAPIFTQAAGI